MYYVQKSGSMGGSGQIGRSSTLAGAKRIIETKGGMFTSYNILKNGQSKPVGIYRLSIEKGKRSFKVKRA